MIENIIYALPELFLICGLILLPLLNLFSSYQRKIIKICLVTIVLSGFMEVIFYNKSFAPHYLQDTAFNTLINMIVYIVTFGVLILARRWYATNFYSPFIFCEALLANLLFCNIMTASTHFAVTVVVFWGMLGVNYLLLNHSAKMKEIYLGMKSYVNSALFCSGVMLFIAFLFYFENGHLAYASLSEFVKVKQNSPEVFCLMLAVVLCFVFLFGSAPFNFWRTETLGQASLPVLAYFLLIPFAASFVALINLGHNVFMVYLEDLTIILTVMGAASMFVGALGACGGKNIHKLLAYACLFHIGVMFLALSPMTAIAVDNLVIYLLIYLLAMYGIISAFFGLKSRGEYLLTLGDITGAAAKKPYISAMITVYLFSLIGFPPFLGFVGLYNIGLNLVLYNHFYTLLFLFTVQIIITYAYMQIIKNLYFEKSKNVFDHTERSIYVIMFINAAFMVLMSLKPDFLIENIKNITEIIFG